jgi:hypothetical protein
MWAAAAGLVALAASSVARAAVVNVGANVLLADTPNQKITLLIAGVEQVAGEDFFAQIGDGGAANHGTATKPVFTNVDILTNSIFAANSVGAQGDPNGSPSGSNAGHPLIWVDGTVTAAGAVADTGVLATLTIDTTGVSSGTFALLLTGVADTLGGFDTTLRNSSGDPIALSVTNGSITVLAPEPTVASAIGAGAAGWLILARRGRRPARA